MTDKVKPTPVKPMPGRQVHGMDYLPDQIQALYAAKVYCDTHGHLDWMGNRRVVIEAALQIEPPVPGKDGEKDNSPRPWVMHIFCQVFIPPAPTPPNYTPPNYTMTPVAMFECDSTGRIENISNRNWISMTDGAEMPGFCTKAYAQLVGREIQE